MDLYITFSNYIKHKAQRLTLFPNTDCLMFYFFRRSFRFVLRRANVRKVSFRISLRWLTYLVNSVDKTKLFCFTDDFLTSASYDTTIKVGSNKLTLILMINWVLTLSKSLLIQETLVFYNTTTIWQTKKILVKIDLAVVPFNLLTCTVGRRSGLMGSALISESSGPGSSPGRGHCVVFLGKTLYSHSACLHPGV